MRNLSGAPLSRLNWLSALSYASSASNCACVSAAGCMGDARNGTGRVCASAVEATQLTGERLNEVAPSHIPPWISTLVYHPGRPRSSGKLTIRRTLRRPNEASNHELMRLTGELRT
jgi:hypothetical protein